MVNLDVSNKKSPMSIRQSATNPCFIHNHTVLGGWVHNRCQLVRKRTIVGWISAMSFLSLFVFVKCLIKLKSI